MLLQAVRQSSIVAISRQRLGYLRFLTTTTPNGECARIWLRQRGTDRILKMLTVAKKDDVSSKTSVDLPKNVQVVDPKVFESKEELFTYKKAASLPATAFWLDVLEGPFTSPKVPGQISPLRKVYLSEEVFRTDVRPDVMARVVRWQRNKAQQGTHKTKTKGEVSGTGKKPWRQKGTGRARQGSLRNPHFRGGGTVFGPTPRDHSHDLNKKERRLGLRSALAARLQEGRLFIVDSLKPRKIETETKVEDHENKSAKDEDEIFVKTHQMADYCEKLHLKQVVVVDDLQRENLVRACRNARHIHYLPQVGLNVYDILNAKEVLMSVNALRILEDRLSETKQRERKWAKRGWKMADTLEKLRKDREAEGKAVEDGKEGVHEDRKGRIQQRRELFLLSMKRRRDGPVKEARTEQKQ